MSQWTAGISCHYNHSQVHHYEYNFVRVLCAAILSYFLAEVCGLGGPIVAASQLLFIYFFFHMYLSLLY